MLDKNHKKDFVSEYSNDLLTSYSFNNLNVQNNTIPFKTKTSIFDGYINSTQSSFKLFFWNNVLNYPESF
jgi:hypothetical protein